MSQRLESYYSKVDVRNPIITKRNVWSPDIANFSARSRLPHPFPRGWRMAAVPLSPCFLSQIRWA
jgi:hypothetical protein